MFAATRLWAVTVLFSLPLLDFTALAEEPRTHTIEIKGFKFVQDASPVRAGDTIVFVNKDVVPHTATAAKAGWDSGPLAKDKSWSFKAEAAGTFDYSCKFHPNMKAKLVVE